MENFINTPFSEYSNLEIVQEGAGFDIFKYIIPNISRISQDQNISSHSIQQFIIQELIKANIQLKRNNREKERENERLRIQQDQEMETWVNNVRSTVTGGKKILSAYAPDFKILCIGDSKLKRRQVYEIFQESCDKHLGLPLLRKNLNTCVLDFEKAKKYDLRKAIKHDRYDLIIVGPHPHSMLNKSIKEDAADLKKRYKLKADVTEKCNKSLSKEFLKVTADKFFQKLFNQNQF